VYNKNISIKIKQTIDKFANSEISSHIDKTLTPPAPFRGNGEIKLIILGQDPTVQNPAYREKVKVTLLLDQPGGLRTYLGKVCKGLGIDLDGNIYATNLLKNFFKVPPDTLRDSDPKFFQKAADFWIPLLKEEIEEFENVPVLPLGEPVLNCLTTSPEWELIRYHWGYEGPGKYGKNFSYIKPSDNVLSRVVFPFPHLPGRSHKIYQQQMEGYLAFMKEHINN